MVTGVFQKVYQLHCGEQTEGKEISWRRCRDAFGNSFLTPEKNNGGLAYGVVGREWREALILI